MSITLSISPHGHLHVDDVSAEEQTALPDGPIAEHIRDAFAADASKGLLHLGTAYLQSLLPPSFAFARDFARSYLTRLCQMPGLETARQLEPIPAPGPHELSSLAQTAPPMKGLEYLNGDVLASWWNSLDALVRQEISAHPRGAAAYLCEANPLLRTVGRVTFHLAENKRDPDRPFAFLATYSGKLSAQGRVQHQPLGKALQEYAGAQNRPALLSLLTPIQQAAERSVLAKELSESGHIYVPQAWTPQQAYRFLQDIPAFEASGLIVRVPDWWKASRPPRPKVSVKVGDRVKSKLSAESLLDFSVNVTLEDESLSESELESILASSGGLVALRGKWVEVDPEKLSEALKHWKQVETAARHGEVSFYEGMRLLSGATLEGDAAEKIPDAEHEWTGISATETLEQTLASLRDPASLGVGAIPVELKAELRPYQQTGVGWLRFMRRLGLGACLADDMGLGKTIQVISLLLHEKRDRRNESHLKPSLLVVPASLIANWKSEIARFAPTLSVIVAHPSEMNAVDSDAASNSVDSHDLVITTYTMLARVEWLRSKEWNLAVLDEAQAIKNSGTRQTRAVKELKSAARIALTGTPVENRLSDLWSLFDFLNPGLLGGAKAFSRFVKRLGEREQNQYGPLRNLVRPYILRRLKTDKKIIADLPEKTEVNAFCPLRKQQAVMYEQAVRDFAEGLNNVDGIKRKGLVLASLMRLKQICNHPSQVNGDGIYDPQQSGKFQRLGELCAQLAERQEKALIFTQFREITAALTEYLTTIFGRPGLTLHGQTAVGKRQELVKAFQKEAGPPFFVLSLKAGGTGLNLTEASHVIHFDRWWNPAVENQATDRAFRIGQKRNVLVHKFVCRGTVEDKIDDLIRQKSGLSRELLDDAGGGEALLTEMSNDELLRFVALDINKAIDS